MLKSGIVFTVPDFLFRSATEGPALSQSLGVYTA